MADSLQTMLTHKEMTATYRAAPTTAGTPMLDRFFTNISGTTGDEVVIPVMGRSNRPMPGNTRGSAPRRHAGQGLSTKQFALFHSFNEYSMAANCLRFLRSSDAAIQRLGKEIIDNTIKEAGERQKMFRDVVVGQIVTTGKVYLDGDGEVLVPSVDDTTGVVTDPATKVVEADYGIEDSQRGRCDQGSADYVFSGAWDTDTTDWFSELQRARDISLKNGAEPPDTVYLHQLQRGAMIASDIFQEWAIQNNRRNDEVLAAAKFENVRGWNFVFLEGYWTAADGTQYPVIPVRNAIIAPASATWRECKEGEQDIPSRVGIEATMEAAIASLKAVQGMFSYAQITTNPLVQLSLFTGDNFGMGLRSPKSLWMPTVFAS
jgi:hypothetical protein